ncbi:hypothetical protein KUTeg_016639 [Tegillarca granosa]|uniref:Secreted protein n=1 Tax=Tegillarca granosa TaxID=220873 RepID=A0ABQ9ELE9_TEGGR|nr:hypothetical protein KUTeg_016639 [Tegillarca granosa]
MLLCLRLLGILLLFNDTLYSFTCVEGHQVELYLRLSIFGTHVPVLKNISYNCTYVEGHFRYLYPYLRHQFRLWLCLRTLGTVVLVLKDCAHVPVPKNMGCTCTYV